jgi:hypothetical protein
MVRGLLDEVIHPEPYSAFKQRVKAFLKETA